MSKFLKRVHWGIIVACFFLPVVRGCNDEVVYPYRDFANNGFDLWMALVFLYPLLLALIGWAAFRVIAPQRRAKALWWIGYALGAALTYILYRIMTEAIETYYIFPVLLWGVLFLGLAKCREENALMDLIGFSLTGFTLWMFPLAFLFARETLIGGWIYIYASVFILTVYLVEFIKRKLKTVLKASGS